MQSPEKNNVETSNEPRKTANPRREHALDSSKTGIVSVIPSAPWKCARSTHNAQETNSAAEVVNSLRPYVTIGFSRVSLP